MKIAVWYNLPSGGAKRALYDHVQGLLALGHKVESWCPPTADQSYLPLGGLIQEHVVPLGSMGGRSGNLFSNLRHRLDINLRFRNMEAHCVTCCQQMEERGCEMLFANTCRAFAVSPIGRFSKLPRLLYLQEPSRSFYEATEKSRWAACTDFGRFPLSVFNRLMDFAQNRLARLYVREEIRNVACYDRVLVNSYYSRESLLRAYGRESYVCYLGINEGLFVKKEVKRKLQFVSVGGFQHGKGADRCIRAIGRIPSDLRPEFVWIGNGGNAVYLEQMKQLAKELGVVFSFRSDVSDDDLVQTLNESLAMLYAPRLEPFGYAPLEANFCGLPVIGVAEGGVRETIVDGENGYLVANPLELTDACLKILKDPEVAERMRDSTFAYVLTRWSLSEAVKNLEVNLLEVSQSSSLRDH